MGFTPRLHGCGKLVASVSVGVNMSPVQFRNPHLVRTLQAALLGSGLSPNRLELEITEAVLLEESEVTLGVLHQLRSLGIRVSMDDFGTGYSSLGYLRSFPFDKIKIDQSFIRDLTTRADAMAIVRAVTGLGRSLGIPTTAEGVETAEQVHLLKAEGCTEVQRFHYAAPKPASEVETMLSTKGLRLVAW
jgi:EAL domain-containing protein (putative c-di-GMP-specific phosphodiesterase class I)